MLSFQSCLRKCLLVLLLGSFIPAQVEALSVSNKGALNYDIPIDTPKATMGMKPDLGLTYDSNNLNGIMGMGWAMKGMSSIYRDTRYPVKFDGNDHYAMDGQKLIYNGNTGRYHKEFEDYSRIQAVGLNTTGSYWLVTKKNGYKYYYGNSVDSHIDAVGKGGKALVWALRKVQDPNGNYYLITYTEDTANGDYYPAQITYTDNDSYAIAGDNTVVFEYEARTDHFVKYLPSKMDVDRRLETIYVRVAGSQVRKYVLTYAYSGNTGNSLLKRVQEFSASNDSLPAIVLDYDEGEPYIFFGEVHKLLNDYEWGSAFDKYPLWGDDQEPQNITHSLIDMNGDGLPDRVSNVNSGVNGLWVGLNINGTDFAAPVKWLADDAWGGGIYDTYIQHGSGGNIYRNLTDMDGDGLPDRVSRYYYHPFLDDWGLFVGINNGNGFNGPIRWDWNLNSLLNSDNPQAGSPDGDITHELRDMTGDGRPDRVMYFYGLDYGLWVAVNNGVGFGTPTQWLPNRAWGHDEGHLPRVVDGDTGQYLFALQDLNGDGRPDRLGYVCNGVAGLFVAINNGSGFDAPVKWISDNAWQNPNSRYPMVRAVFGWLQEIVVGVIIETSGEFKTGFIDLNGDGLADRVMSSMNNEMIDGSLAVGICVAINNGSGFDAPVWWEEPLSSEYHRLSIENYPTVGADGIKYSIMDFNGDGLPDRLRRSVNEIDINGNSLYYCRSNGREFHKDTPLQRLYWESFIGQYVRNFNCVDLHNRFNQVKTTTLDMNGDGLPDRIWSNLAGVPGFWVGLNIGRLPDKLVSVNNGRGGTVGITYEPASLVSGAVQGGEGYDYVYPNKANTAPRLIVTGITLIDGLKTSDFTYSYNRGMIQSGTTVDRVDLGFNWVNKRENSTLCSDRTVYNQIIPLQGTTYDKVAYDAAWRWEGIKAYRHTWRADSGAPAGVRFVYLANQYDIVRKTNNDYDRNRKGFGYDQYGNINNLTAYGRDLPVLTGDESNAVTEYIYDTTSWILNKPKRVALYGLDVNLNNVLQQETQYLYDGHPYGSIGKGNLTNEIMICDEGNVSLTHGYDNWGNRAWTGDGKDHKTTTTFDPTFHADVTRVVNDKGHAQESTYDALRHMEVFTDANAVDTYHRFDQFGRKTKLISTPDNETYPTQQEDYYVDGVFPESKRTLTLEDANTANAYEKRVYYDGFGRIVQQKAESGTVGSFDTVDFMYDGLGRQIRETVPYRTATSSYTTQNWTGGYTETAYDAAGRVTQAMHPDGSVSRYIYDGFIKYSIDTTNRVKSVRADGQGKIVEVKEYDGIYPSHTLYATTTYRYNTGTGHLVRVTDADGNQINYTYNKLGQRTRMIHPDRGQWDFTFDNNGNVTSQIDGNRDLITYEYDNLDRLTATRYPSGGDIEYQYDEAGHGYSIGRPTHVSYPGGSEDFEYDGRGQITNQSVTIGEETRSESFTYDSMGRVRTMTYPDGEIVSHSYGGDTLLKTVSGASNFVTNMAYMPNRRIAALSYGNGATTTYDYYDLSTEPDPNTGRTSSQQLRRISVPGVMDLSYQYDLQGNVQRKTDNLNGTYTETYTYDHLNRLYSAVASIFGTKAYRYDEVGNMTEKDGQVCLYDVHRLKSKGDKVYAYDDNGNMIFSDGMTYDYNYDNMLTSTSTGASFQYFGKVRVKKLENGVTTWYFFPNYDEKE